MIATLLAAQLTAGVFTADTVAPGAGRVQLAGGISAASPTRLGLPVVPYLTGDLEWVRGVADRVDWSVRYTTALFVSHRVGTRVRVRVVRAGSWTIGTSVTTAARGYYLPFQGSVYGASATTGALALITRRLGATAALSLEAGATMVWFAADQGNGRAFVDTRPAASSVDTALSLEWVRNRTGLLSLRLEFAAGLLGADPTLFFGTYPRLVFGGSWGS